MARRGKTANRQARQRRRSAQRTAPQRPAASSASGPALAPSSAAGDEAAPSESVASQAATTSRSLPASQRRTTTNPRVTVAGPSRLSERAVEEYHYVGRDLRNIGVLVAIMAAVLVVAVIVFTVMGFGHAG